MPTLNGRNYQAQELQYEYGQLYEARMGLFGTSAIIVPILDTKHGQPNTTTFTSVGEEQVTWTYSEAPTSFDSPPDLTASSQYQGIIPFINLNGSDEGLSTPDAAFWTPAGPDSISIAMWVRSEDVGSPAALFTKWDRGTTDDREWQLRITSAAQTAFEIYDEGNSAQIGRRSDGTLVIANQWTHIGATYDGDTAASDIKVYLNGVNVDDADALGGAGYTNINDGATVVTIGYEPKDNGPTSYYNGDIAGAPLGPLIVLSDAAVATPDVILRDYELGRRALGL